MKIKEIRHSRGWTQKQLAEHLGVALGTVRNWEQGIRTPDRRSKMAIEKLLMGATVMEESPKFKVHNSYYVIDDTHQVSYKDNILEKFEQIFDGIDFSARNPGRTIKELCLECFRKLNKSFELEKRKAFKEGYKKGEFDTLNRND